MNVRGWRVCRQTAGRTRLSEPSLAQDSDPESQHNRRTTPAVIMLIQTLVLCFHHKQIKTLVQSDLFKSSVASSTVSKASEQFPFKIIFIFSTNLTKSQATKSCYSLYLCTSWDTLTFTRNYSRCSESDCSANFFTMTTQTCRCVTSIMLTVFTCLIWCVNMIGTAEVDEHVVSVADFGLRGFDFNFQWSQNCS